MSYKPDESVWMAYLYDELEGEEKLMVEKYLQENPEAQQELLHWQHVRKMLSTVKDKEVIAPPVVIEDSKQRYFWNAPYVKTISSIAASLFILIIAGKLTGLRVDYANQELRIGFGEPVKTETTQLAALTPEQVQAMINNSLQQNNAVEQVRWNETQAKLDESIRKNLALNSSTINNLVQQASRASQDEVRQFVASLQNENQQMVKDYFQLTTSEQQKYIEGLLVDFAKYLQQQRKNDLEVIQTRLTSVEQGNSVFKQETEQILASIISSGAPSGTNATKSY